MRFVTGLAAGLGTGYLLARMRRQRARGSECPAPLLPSEPGPHGGVMPPPDGDPGPVLSEPVRPVSLQGAPAGDVLAMLAREHDHLRREIDALIAFEAEGPHESGDLRAAAQRVVSAASRHEVAEEEHFWPFVRRRLRDGDALADTGTAHELDLKRVLQALDSRHPGDIDFDDLIREMKALVSDHVAFEEGHVWPALDAVMTEEERVGMGASLGRAEELAPTRPHPSELADPTKHRALSRAVALIDRGVDRVAARGHGPHD